MKVLENVDLYSYSTMRIHSIGSQVIIPESIFDLKTVVDKLKKENTNFHIVLAGSNIVFLDYVKTPILYLMELDKDIDVKPDGVVVCGCSVRIQTLIQVLKNNRLGGLEYLYAAPASVGGAVFMNAGRGKKHNKSISDYLIQVDYLDWETGEVKSLYPNEDTFSYRYSVFQENKGIILKAHFKFNQQDSLKTQQLINERLEYSKKYLDTSKPSCGSVFRKANPILIRLVKGMRIGGAMFSKKTPNWISNVENASAKDVLRLIKRVEFFHKLLLLKCKTEIRFLE